MDSTSNISYFFRSAMLEKLCIFLFVVFRSVFGRDLNDLRVTYSFAKKSIECEAAESFEEEWIHVRHFNIEIVES